jgi:hypothetical protein
MCQNAISRQADLPESAFNGSVDTRKELSKSAQDGYPV